MISDALYRLLLHVLPRDVRRAEGDDMVQLFRDYRREAAGHPMRLVTLWGAAVRDVLSVAAASRARRARLSPSRGGSMRALGADFRHGLRLLRRYPSTSLLAVATLALGMGVNTAIFSVVDAVLLRRLPYAEADRLARVWESRPTEGAMTNPASPADFLDWRRMNHVFERVAAHASTTVSLSGDGEPLQLDGAAVSSGFFELLRIRPALGRTFTADEEVVGKHHVAIISDSLWHRRFGADPDIVTRTVTLNGNPWRVIGVLPADFQFIDRGIDVWSPLALEGGPKPPPRGAHSLDVYARLKPGVTIAQANDAMARIGGELAETYPDTNRGHGARVVAMQDDFVRPIRASLLVLFAAVGFVLLIACLNVASLLLARAASRTREMAVRAALGASRLRLLSQTLVEGLALAIVGGLAGLAVARVTIAALPAVMPAQLSIVGLSAVAIDWRVLTFAFAMSIATGVIFSMVPAWQISKPQVVESLKAGGRQATGVRRGTRLTLVIGEVALAALTLTGAGLAIRSFAALLAEPLGFDTANRTAITVWLPTARYPTPEIQRAKLDELEHRLATIAGVSSIGAVDILPLAGDDSRRGVTIEGQTETLDAPTRMHPRSVTPGYFHAMAIPLIEGRSLSRDDHARAQPVAVVNATAARRFWPNDTAIGKRFRFSDTDPWRTIVGVAGDVRHWGLDQPVNPMVVPAAGAGGLGQSHVRAREPRRDARARRRRQDPAGRVRFESPHR